MDYWDYLAHSQKGEERAGHRYYARVQVGTNKLGFPKYRYFYDAREYGAYKTREQQSKPENARNSTNGRTTFTSGDGLYSVKTVRDYKKPLRNAKKKLSALKKEASDYHRKNRWQPTTSVGNRDHLTVTETNRYGKTRTKTYEGDEARKHYNDVKTIKYGQKENNERVVRERKRGKKLEAIYQTDKALKKAKRHAQKAGMDIRRTLRNKMGGKKKNNISSGKGSGSSARRVKASNSRVIGEKHSMDRKRWDTQNRAAQVKRDAKTYRKKRRAMSSQKRAGQKRIMDNIRERPYYQPMVKR